MRKETPDERTGESMQDLVEARRLYGLAAVQGTRKEAALKKKAEEEARVRAKLKAASEAKKAAKLEKKTRRNAPSAFALQAEREAREAAERLAGEQRAAALVAEQEGGRL